MRLWDKQTAGKVKHNIMYVQFAMLALALKSETAQCTCMSAQRGCSLTVTAGNQGDEHCLHTQRQADSSHVAVIRAYTCLPVFIFCEALKWRQPTVLCIAVHFEPANQAQHAAMEVQ